jgi:hypothetical protein
MYLTTYSQGASKGVIDGEDVTKGMTGLSEEVETCLP